MPVRAIKKLIRSTSISTAGLYCELPKSIEQTYGINPKDVYSCEVLRHFDVNSSCVRDINRVVEVPAGPYIEFPREFGDPHYRPTLSWTGADVVTSYGLLEREFLELLFTAIKRERRVWLIRKDVQQIAIFPEREYSDFDFSPT